MISYQTGDIFQSGCQTLGNPVNLWGVMGKGLAAEFKRRYPAMAQEWAWFCRYPPPRMGTLHLHTDTTPWVLNIPTKNHWKDPSRVEYIDAALNRLTAVYQDWGIKSLALPKLGCGEGGLDWEREVRPVVEAWLLDSPLWVEVYV